MISHGSLGNQFFWWFGSDTTKGPSHFELNRIWLAVSLAFLLRILTKAMINFSGRRGVITIVRKVLGKRDTIRPFGDCSKPWLQSVYSCSGWSQAKQKTCSRRIAQWRLTVCVRERRSPLGKSIEMGCFCQWMATKMPDPIILIINGYEKYVWLVSCIHR